jgi:hypothetical protein
MNRPAGISEADHEFLLNMSKSSKDSGINFENDDWMKDKTPTEVMYLRCNSPDPYAYGYNFTEPWEVLQINPLDSNSYQDKIWHDVCPYCNGGMLVTPIDDGGVMPGMKKDCRFCFKSFIINDEITRYIEIPYPIERYF